jgi:pyruvate/2-oxoacid:ferredoxin oxidoreductase alpha subunit
LDPISWEDLVVGEEILIEIDETLDQLIRNAEALKSANIQELTETEIEAFQKTQDSLLHHFLYMDQFLAEKKMSQKVVDARSVQCKIKEKLGQYEKLKSVCHSEIEKTYKNKRALLLKRRAKKRLLVNP